MKNFVPNTAYFFMCKNCRFRFSRLINLGMKCPKCNSFKVYQDPTVCK